MDQTTRRTKLKILELLERLASDRNQSLSTDNVEIIFGVTTTLHLIIDFRGNVLLCG